MKRLGVLMAAAALGAALLASGPAEARWGGGGFHGGGWGGHGFAGGWGHGGWGHGGWGWGHRGWGYGGWGLAGLGLGLGLAGLDYGYDYPGYGYGYGYPGYAYGYGYPGYGYAAAPLVTGRSMAIGGMGGYCSTPVRTCELYQASFIGNGCSCRVVGGHARGVVTH